MSTLDRRTLLRGLLGGAAVSLALPPLEIFMNAHGTAWADGQPIPVRFALWTWANGIVPELWIPDGTGTGPAWSLSPALAPLAAHKAKLSVVSGLEVRAADKVVPHWSGFAPLLTGRPLVGLEANYTMGGPTLDQVVSAQLAGTTPFRSVEVSALGDAAISYNGENSPNPPEDDPWALFDRLFGPTFREPGGESAPLDPRLALRQSTLDVVRGHVDDLKRQVGQRDKDRLDQHLSGIRDLELRLARLAEGPPDFASCRRATEPPAAETLVDPFLRHRAMAEVLAMAWACDLTRVVSVSLMPPVTNYQFPGTTDGHHQLTHNEPGDQPMVQANTVRAMEELAFFLSALDGIQEGDGTALDHAVVFATSDVSFGRTHSYQDYPCVLAGSASGALRTDVHFRSALGNASMVPLTILRALGIAAPSYGVDDLATSDTLSAVEA